MRTGQLGLSVRERGAARQTQVPLNVRAVSSWLDALPIANIGESARQVYQFLVDINGAPLEVSERLKIMQALTKVVSHITDALRKHYIGQSVSLNEKQRKIAALAQAMQSEMAIGYKTVVEDMLGEGHQRYNAQVLVPALYYAIHYLSLVLLRCYQLYSQQPARLWKELHALYHFAEQNGLHRQTAISDYNELTVESAYLRIVLTACANPYQLRQREIEQLFDAAATLASEALLQPYRAGKDLFFLDLDSDIGPQSSALTQQTPGPHCRSVQLDAVLARVQDDLRSTSGLMLGVAKNPVQQLGATLLRHLVRAYGNMASRSFSRTPANGTIRIAIGLSASHYLLSGETQPKTDNAYGHDSHDLNTLEGSLRHATLVDDDRQHTRILPGVKKPAGGPTDPWEKLYRVKEGWDASHKQADVSTTAPRNFTENAAVSYEFQIAAMINISPGGYCLGLRGNVPAQTQTGEIVGLTEQDEHGNLHWNIGTIRWMKRIPDGALHIGIQLIAPNARPVLTQVRNSQAATSNYQRGLLLPALKGIGQPATLITAPMPYAVKQKVRIKDGDKVYDVQLTKQAAASASYRQFHFNDALSGRDQPTDSGNKASDGDSFDSVWELL